MLTLVWDNTRSLITGKEIRVRLAVKRREKREKGVSGRSRQSGRREGTGTGE